MLIKENRNSEDVEILTSGQDVGLLLSFPLRKV
jgi:hypothetical protein